ncbi:cysteine dioxygenase [Purpureocillium lavendulum]|uniref:Cysteine dioxygenase n=1 Tax=Purpureocillium lavendulum TaxID=1247861 RepID=A0AB34G1A8_9HYPO|nr:cysteine dioxygenase [Purpureocillium lavendulum]
MSNSSVTETINAYGPISSPHIVFSDIFSSRRSSMASHATDSRKNSASEPSKSHKKEKKEKAKIPTLIMPSIRCADLASRLVAPQNKRARALRRLADPKRNPNNLS